MQRSWFLVLLLVALAGCRTESDSSAETLDELSGDSWESAGQTGGEVEGPTSPGGSNEGGDGLTGGNSGSCDEQATSINDAQVKTELGFSIADVTAFASGTKQAPLLWHEPTAFTRSGEVPAVVTPESGTTEITFEITPTAGGARYITSTPAETAGNEGGLLLGGPGGSCSDRIEIDVDVTLTTEGGAFDETISATLHARNTVSGDAIMAV
jgi:hypothetical protein